jgi:hypothetical protein
MPGDRIFQISFAKRSRWPRDGTLGCDHKGRSKLLIVESLGIQQTHKAIADVACASQASSLSQCQSKTPQRGECFTLDMFTSDED